MTAVLVLSCDGWWPRFRCRGALPIPKHAAFTPMTYAQDRDWSRDGDTDYCPAHTARKETAQ